MRWDGNVKHLLGLDTAGISSHALPCAGLSAPAHPVTVLVDNLLRMARVIGICDVKDDGERDQWRLAPLVSVGPLHFGANHGEVVAALGHALASPTVGDPRQGSCIEAQFREVGVTVYYTDACLYCVAIDALRGPQVTLDGQALVGRVPSEVEQWMLDEAGRRGWELRYTHAADPELANFGLIVRAQRAGDVVLSRPVFLDQRAEVTWDYVPAREWKAF